MQLIKKNILIYGFDLNKLLKTTKSTHKN